MTSLQEGQEEMLSLPGGYQVHTYRFGGERGKPVVLLHGGGIDSAMLSWRDTIPALVEAGFQVYMPDWPGYGQSPPPPKPFTQDLLIEVTTGLLDTWGLKKASLAGISMGGGAALGFTLTHPERVEKFILIGSYGLQDRAPAHFFSALFVKLPLINNLTYAMMRSSRRLIRETMKTIICNPTSLTETLLDEVTEAIKDPNAGKTFAQFQLDEVRFGGLKTCYMPRLGEIKAPILIVHGTADIGVPVKYAREAAERIPNAHLHIIEGAGHWTQRDYPEEVNRVIIDFLKEDRARINP
ncbi:MAG: alpha/beta hydrolase [Anaerolineae bacterium]|nr:alpha/beta hydrolase [Anaerolineae bacterium]